MGTNAAISLPQAGDVRAALRKLDLLVVSEVVSSNDTLNSGAHGSGASVHLPGQGWSEKDGTVTNSERRITRQRKFNDPVGESQPDWWAVSQVAKRMGFGGFDYGDVSEIFTEHARLSGFENGGTRDFDIGRLGMLDGASYHAMGPVQWPVPANDAGHTGQRFFAAGGYYTPTRRAQFVAVAPPQLAEQVSAAFPLLLNTGRIRDQWHTMTRTGLSPRLGSHITEPFVAVHPSDAGRFGLTDDGLARVSNHHGAATYRVAVTLNQERGSLFVPIHWTDETASDARTGTLVHAIVDPFSGQPDAKATPVSIAPVTMRSAGFLLARTRFPLPRSSFWAWSAIAGGFAARVDTDGDDEGLLAALKAATGDEADVLRYRDERRGIARTALIEGDRLVGALFLAPVTAAPKWSVLSQAWDAPAIDKALRRIILSGKRLDGAADEGPNVCACFGVPHGRIVAAVVKGADSAAAVGKAIKAGTNCGSCIPELKRIIAETAAHSRAQAAQGAS